MSQNYNIQSLNIERQSQNRISTATDVFNSMSVASSKVGGDNSSNSEVKVLAKNSFWDEFESSLKTILTTHHEDKTHYAIHRQAGLVSIHANQQQHDLVEDYIEKLKLITNRQVLIEAKIVEVNLKDNFKSGIDWMMLNNAGKGFNLNAGFEGLSKKAPFGDTHFSNKEGVTIGGVGNKFSGILNILEEFGISRTLSSPRLTVMNNQVAILKVAQNKVYFKLNYDKQFSTNNNFQNFSLSSDIQTVPIGLVMSVQPSIDDETGDIVLCLRPTISKLATTEADPAVDIALANAGQPQNNNPITSKQSLIPVVDVKEIDSVLRVRSGEIAMLGGLMEVKTTSDRSGIPGFKAVPFLAGENETGEVVELVILLKATIVDQPPIHKVDHRLMNEYVTDTRKMSA